MDLRVKDSGGNYEELIGKTAKYILRSASLKYGWRSPGSVFTFFTNRIRIWEEVIPLPHQPLIPVVVKWSRLKDKGLFGSQSSKVHILNLVLLFDGSELVYLIDVQCIMGVLKRKAKFQLDAKCENDWSNGSQSLSMTFKL